MSFKRNELSFENEKIYAGFDVHAKSWKVTILTEHLLHKTFVMPPSPEKLYEYLIRNFPGATYYSAYEAGFCGLWIHRRLHQQYGGQSGRYSNHSERNRSEGGLTRQPEDCQRLSDRYLYPAGIYSVRANHGQDEKSNCQRPQSLPMPR